MIPYSIYHYCGSAAFYEIIKSRNLRLYSLFETNDFLERKWIDKIIEDFFNNFNGSYPTQHFSTFKNYVITDYSLNRGIELYFIAFSEEGDLLSQWRGYSEDGTGFSIGFNPTYFEINNEVPTTSANPDRTIGLVKVLYVEQEMRHIVNSTIQLYMEKFQSDNFLDKSPAMLECAGALVKYSSYMKNPGFYEEKEWRILYTPWEHHNKFGSVEILGKLKNKKYHNGKGYFELFFSDKKSSNPINEIILGPKNNTPENEIASFLAENSFHNIKVIKSKISYR